MDMFESCGAVKKSHERIKKLYLKASLALDECSSELNLETEEKEFLGRALGLFIPKEDLSSPTPESL